MLDRALVISGVSTRGRITSLGLLAAFLLIQPRMQPAFAERAGTACAQIVHWDHRCSSKKLLLTCWLPMWAAAWSNLGGCLLVDVSGHIAHLLKYKHTLLLQESPLKSDLSL